MSAHLAELLAALQQRCVGMGNLVQTAVREAIAGVVTRNPAAGQGVFATEERIDTEEVEIERQAINLLALHQPAASDLRMIFATVKINGDLERIADCAVNIAQQLQPYVDSGVELPRDMRLMGEAMLKQVDDTLRALGGKESQLAEQVARGDDLLDALYNQLLQELQAEMVADAAKVPGYMALIMMARNYERIGDHCTNIAEDLLYRTKGRIVRHTHDPR